MKQIWTGAQTGGNTDDHVCIFATEMYNRRAKVSETYDFFRDVSEDVGRVFPYGSCLAVLRQTYDWGLNVTNNRSS